VAAQVMVTGSNVSALRWTIVPKKKPYRYRWPDEVRDEVLALLLELNAQRAKEEAHAGAGGQKKKGNRTVAKRALEQSETQDLFS